LGVFKTTPGFGPGKKPKFPREEDGNPCAVLDWRKIPRKEIPLLKTGEKGTPRYLRAFWENGNRKGPKGGKHGGGTGKRGILPPKTFWVGPPTGLGKFGGAPGNGEDGPSLKRNLTGGGSPRGFSKKFRPGALGKKPPLRGGGGAPLGDRGPTLDRWGPTRGF